MLAVRSQWFDTDIRGEGIQSGAQLRAADLHYDKIKAPTPLKGTFNLQIMRYMLEKCQIRSGYPMRRFNR